MTTIRPNPLPLSPQGPQTQEHSKLAAQRQFFAAALRQAQGVSAPTMPTAAAPAPAAAPTASPQAPASAPPADGPQKVLRPGSLIDIRI